jgi:hypothetical protein
MPRVGIDKKAFQKGHSYLTLNYYLDRITVAPISQGNDIHRGNSVFSQLSQE